MLKKAGRGGKGWPESAPEIIRLIRSLAIADARRDHEEAGKMAAPAKAKVAKGYDADNSEPWPG